MNTKQKKGLGTSGFTIMELLVVIAIIALIVGVVLASIKSSKDKASDVEVKKALSEITVKAEGKEIAPGVVNYQAAFTAVDAPNVIGALATKLGIASDQYDYSVTADGYAIVFPLKSGKYYCVDSTPTTMEVTGLLNTTGSKTCSNATRVVDQTGKTGSGSAPTITTLASTGKTPMAIARDSSGNIYTANQNANSVTKITPDGTASVLGSTGGRPTGIVIDSSGNVFTMNWTDSTITKITPSGVSSVFATVTKPFNTIAQSIVIDSSNNLYVPSYTTNTVLKITPAGSVSTFASTGPTPTAIVIDSSGNIYTSNHANFSITKITPAGSSSTLGTLTYEASVMVPDGSGGVYSLNQSDANLWRTTSGGSSSIFASMVTGGLQSYSLNAIARDSGGTVYASRMPASGETYDPNTPYPIYKITSSGTASVYTNYGVTPSAFLVDSSGNLYIANGAKNYVSKVTP